ncbi:CpsD/CapB family tyrosine-protein kinase [Fundicoccus culcitae]|uniref:Tyrosine-protein kinase CpsD n=1 Tax=Fundicoccus culcitae TaxID=2969821 RepID=A0ABY5P9P4_9LACT|nr:CpsD/CapB family tyrosine-protein kinase [Fundicoccus culcitae]UUX35249.1 CpsD/CapB family tyrosine-protein kinase [Fundicoccus culcitae]
MFKRKEEYTSSKKRVPLISYVKPQSIQAEEFRTLRTNIEFAQFNKDVKSIAVTSSVPNEGKSTVAANLAHVFGGVDNKNVLLVDGDLRNPTIHRSFGLDNTKGLSSLLFDNTLQFNEIVQKSRELNMYFLTSGPVPPNPSELLSSARMTALMQELSDNFDIVIYDTPPVTLVTDAKILATKADSVLLVVKQNFSRKDVLKRAIQELNNINADILGFVMTNLSNTEKYGYGYKNYREQKDNN